MEIKMRRTILTILGTLLITVSAVQMSAASDKFLALYAVGLETLGDRNSPLEVIAYNAEESFAQSDQSFNAENLVAEELSRMLGTTQ
jgi:hypothetical protein